MRLAIEERVMSISDRYSCQEHGQIVETGCLACEFYHDISTIERQRDELRAEVERLRELLQQFLDSGVELDDRRMSYKVVQISNTLWDEGQQAIQK